MIFLYKIKYQQQIMDKMNEAEPFCQEFVVNASQNQENLQLSLIESNNKFKQGLQSNQNLNKYRTFQRWQDSTQNESIIKKNEQTKIKFRKLKQKLMSQCLKHQQISLGKQVTSTNKARIMKLSIELQKQVNNQVRDYIFMQNTMKQVLKVLEQKKQNDLHVIRQSRFIPSVMQFYKKILSTHKNQYRQSLKIIDLANKILLIFCCLSINRQYLILTNRLQIMMNLLNWSLSKRQQIQQNTKFFTNFFTILSCLIQHNFQNQQNSIVQQTIELIFYSQLIKRLKHLLEMSITDDGINDEVIIKYSLHFFLSILIKIDPENQIRSIDDIENTISVNTIQNIEQFITYLGQFSYNLLFDKQKSLKESPLCNSSISILIYIITILNKNCKLMLLIIQKNVSKQFLSALNYIISYCKQNYDQSQDLKQLLNQTIILIGYLSYSSMQIQNKMNQFKIVYEICNLPIQFVMDKKLVEILNPTLCCLIYNNQNNFKIVCDEMSFAPLIKYLKNQIQLTAEEKSGMHSRKLSMSSINSINTQCSSNIFFEKEPVKYNLKSRFPMVLWKSFLDILQKFE